MKTTVSTASGAMPKIDRAALMQRAWAIFRETYRYPQIKFSDSGPRWKETVGAYRDEIRQLQAA
jgi:hypothetical protein